jgi:hypothetical protein
MSRAQLIDERMDEEVNDAAALEPEENLESQEEEVAQAESNLPEKYQGKSLEDVVQMHQEAEKLLGKQSSEVGELRKVVDDYIQAQLSERQAPEKQQEEDDVDFFLDPKTAISRAIDSHPKIREAETYTQQYKKQAALARLQSAHPDMQEILQDNKFAEWVKGSKIRTQLFVQADQQYDYDAADELLSLWKERSQVAKQTVAVEKQVRKQQLKSANTGNARGATEGNHKKKYRRADVIKLMRDDPERYQALSPELLIAYAEGRVI